MSGAGRVSTWAVQQSDEGDKERRYPNVQSAGYLLVGPHLYLPIRQED
jgi:hypothetical protein